MKIINLYKYNREKDKVTVSPIKPNGEYIELYRLVADEGKKLVNGDLIVECIDVEKVEGWEETDKEVDNQTQ